MIITIGSLNIDLIAATPRLPRPGETVPGTDFSTAAGGKGANQALAARRAGATVRMAGAVGNDQFAAPALELLSGAGVDLVHVAHRPVPTGTALILVGGDGENMITVIPGANGTVTPDMARAALSGAGTGDTLLLQMEIPAAAIEAALAAARAQGVRSILNIAPLTGEVTGLSALADIVVANETEFEMLSGKPAGSPAEIRACLEALHGARGQTLVVTLGADGVLAAHDGGIIAVAAIPISPVDTVGAGDTFCGYLAQGLDAGLDFASALGRASVAGALACLRHGAQPSIPLSAEVDRRLATAG
ncbi:ribokinase [Hoeflea marina]|uniref:Ribokinase n=1 Tax=Hoeflea marina TaxID=274592 RepID=A0A317PHF7_9HYPH|nr:ribokinase [Hoeflea marina]PWW00069.1 ribokinase [Hoeflea marina]